MPTKAGSLTYRELFDRLALFLRQENVFNICEKFALFPFLSDADLVPDEFAWVACYAVPANNGDKCKSWVHVDVVTDGVDTNGCYVDRRILFAYGSTCDGLDAAQRVATACSKFFAKFVLGE